MWLLTFSSQMAELMTVRTKGFSVHDPSVPITPRSFLIIDSRVLTLNKRCLNKRSWIDSVLVISVLIVPIWRKRLESGLWPHLILDRITSLNSVRAIRSGVSWLTTFITGYYSTTSLWVLLGQILTLILILSGTIIPRSRLILVVPISVSLKIVGLGIIPILSITFINGFASRKILVLPEDFQEICPGILSIQ